MPLLLQMGEVRECGQAMRGERVAPVGSLQGNKDLSPTVRQLGGHERGPSCPGQGLLPAPTHGGEHAPNATCLWFSLLPYQSQTRC